MTFSIPGMITTLKKNKNENYVESPIDLKALYDKDKAIIESRKMRKEQIAAMENWDKGRNREEETKNMFLSQYTNRIKVGTIEAASKTIADRVLSETFANIYVKALPLDKEFVTENIDHLKDFAYMYIRKLGGMDYLKKRVTEAKSPFLDKLYRVCLEQSNKMSRSRAKKVMSQNSTDMLHEIIEKPCTDEENKQILKNIDTLGADELAELVKQKIINVVKDEKMREREEREFRTVIKNDLLDTSPGSPVENEISGKEELPDTGDRVEDMSNDDMKSTPDDAAKPDTSVKKNPGGSGFNPDKIQKKEKQDMVDKEEKKVDKKAKDIEQDADVNDTDDELKDKKKDKKGKDLTKEGAILVNQNLTLEQILESYNPVDRTLTRNEDKMPKSFLFSIASSVMKNMITDVSVTESKSVEMKNNPRYKAVMENPLNLDVFATYLQNGDDSINTLEQAPISEPNVIGSDKIDTGAIITESVIQYGLLETAYTMKLINVTPAMVKEQADYLMSI